MSFEGVPSTRKRNLMISILMRQKMGILQKSDPQNHTKSHETIFVFVRVVSWIVLSNRFLKTQ